MNIESDLEDILKKGNAGVNIPLHYKDIVILVNIIKQLTNGSINNNVIETQTIVAEDNNIELNYGGNHETSLDGGFTILSGISNDENSTFMIDKGGYWVAKPGIKNKNHTPKTSNDPIGEVGEFTYDDTYLYMKTNKGWGRSNLDYNF